MKKVLITIAVLVTLTFGLANVAKADTCPSGSTDCLSTGGVTFTFTQGGPDGSGGFLVDLAITGATSTSDTLSSFAVEFSTGGTNATNVSLQSGPSGWAFTSQAPNNAGGCGSNSTSAHWCFSGTGIAFPNSNTTMFVFDVTGTGGAPDTADLMAFQSPAGIPGISTTTGVGGGTSAPEPASMLLLGLGLVGAPFLRRKRS